MKVISTKMVMLILVMSQDFWMTLAGVHSSTPVLRVWQGLGVLMIHVRATVIVRHQMGVGVMLVV